MKKASLTVFYTLLLPLIMSLLFTMAECVRIYALGDNLKVVSQQSTESGFSNYIKYLWDNYHILGVDYTCGKGYGLEGYEKLCCGYAHKNVNPFDEIFHTACVNLTMMECDKATVTKYGLLTDTQGAAVIDQGKRYAIEYLGFEALEILKNAAFALEKGETNDAKTLVDEAQSRSAQAREAQEAGESEFVETPTRPSVVPEDYENPLDAFSKLSEAINGGLLQLVLPYGIVSTSVVDEGTLPSNRLLNTGNAPVSPVGYDDKLWYILYMLNQYSRFDDKKDRDGLDYEMEYVICGHGSDRENLSGVVMRILAIREALNVASLVADPTLMSIVHSLASFLAALLAAPYLEPVFVAAIVSVWALLETVLDLRRIMSGGTVYIAKTYSTWSSDLFHITKVIESGAMSMEAQNGIDYGVYLAGILSAEGIEKIGIRSCDVLQQSLNAKKNYTNLMLDTVMYQADIEYDYSAKPMFLTWVNIPGGKMDYGFKGTSHINYLKEN